MPESPLKDHPLGLAARYNDAAAEEKGLQATVEEMGLDIGLLLYAAKQRAIRTVAVQSQRRELKLLLGNQSALRVVPPLTPAEKIAYAAAELACLDGIAIGWKAREIHDRGGRDG